MGWNGLERSRLDYLLTDLLPVELSELFSFRPLYEYMLKKENAATLDILRDELKMQKAKGYELFDNSWASTPLTYNIMKGANSTRKMSVLQPISAINVWLFVEAYQNNFLSYLENNSCFSIRYHKKNTELYYKTKTKSITNYFQKQSRRVGKGVIEQSGEFYNIHPFKLINTFPDSQIWRMCNFEYKHYGKIDYKSCFESIYTHSYKWIIERNVIDSKNAHNSHLFIAIDRVLQNINGKSSNGLPVGPEFSRMMAEILLQQIDVDVKKALANRNYQKGRDYAIFRYVDDVHIFADSSEIIETIILLYRECGERYLLRLNDLKQVRGVTPWLKKEWMERTQLVAERIDGFFYNPKSKQFKELHEDERHLVRTDHIKVDRIKDEITTLVKTYPEDKGTIASYLLSTMLNNVSNIKDGYSLFGKGSQKKSALFLELALFMYAFYPSFAQTRKIISLVVYMNDEVDYKNNETAKRGLSELLNRYSFIFSKGNIFDLLDWFPFMREYGIAFSAKTETTLLKSVNESGNALAWANILLYSKYNATFFNEVRILINSLIENHLSNMIDKDIKLYKEMWFVLIFHNCSYIDTVLHDRMAGMIQDLKNQAAEKLRKLSIITSLSSTELRSKHLAVTTELICNFMQRQTSSGRKNEDSFFNWNKGISIGDQITYRTYQRTIFRRLSKKRSNLYASIE